MRRRALALVLLIACGTPDVIGIKISPGMPTSRTVVLDATSKQRRRMVPPEAFLRAYMMWFGGLGPEATFRRAREGDLFDSWADYLAALGLPDYHFDAPRATQSNTVMLATFGRLGEALCIRSAEHDLHERPDIGKRIVFAFDPMGGASFEAFLPRFDVLHRTFLGYPAELAAANRVGRFYGLFVTVSANHTKDPRLSPEELAWAAVCTALVQHPEAGLY